MANQLLEIERAFSQLRMNSSLPEDADQLVADAIAWYTRSERELSPQKIRCQPKLIKDAVGDYLYISGSNLSEVVSRLPDYYDQDVLSEVAAKHVSRLVAKRYPDLKAAMYRSFMTSPRYASGVTA